MDLALFDLDETLLCEDSATLWLRWLVSQGFAPAELVRQQPVLLEKARRGALAGEDYRLVTLSPLAGLSCRTVSGWVDRFIQRDILPRIYPDARRQLLWHRERGDYIIILSASGNHLVSPIARTLGAHQALAPDAGVEDDRFTGAPHPATAHHDHAQRVEHWLAGWGGEPFRALHGYSDSIHDRALLERVDHASVINPTPELHALASRRGWQVRAWQR
ncbi:HAD-IB family hydrolase [Chimaeribacter californicus]|uniref:HAD-IB family hydrolase n=1 Tax=Chimaeribacter californicus TaxID=2060067 RepID=A0A2N5E6X6_9GAMM|nr:HAD-IB family hydrolase [Chimaeribacter californicus]PLR37243.1 HAD-IB family hydrolase [Chimaeribacter californicus]